MVTNVFGGSVGVDVGGAGGGLTDANSAETGEK